MEPIRARYAGTCARTGKSYAAGALIVQLANKKWALAQDKKGAVKAASGPPPADYRYLKFSGSAGKIKHVNVSLPLYCSEALMADNLLEAAKAGQMPADMTPYTYKPEGGQWVCRHAGNEYRLTPATKAEIAEAFSPETKRCTPARSRECGCEFTYADCKRNGGDWNENGGYCGC